MTRTEQTRQLLVRPPQISRPEQTRLDQTRPDQTRPEQTGIDYMPTRKIYPPVSRLSERRKTADKDQEPDRQPIDEMVDTTPDPIDAERAEFRRQGEELRLLREELIQLRATRDDTPDLDRSRRSTTEDSAFGGTVFKPSGLAALLAFKRFTGINGANPSYD